NQGDRLEEITTSVSHWIERWLKRIFLSPWLVGRTHLFLICKSYLLLVDYLEISLGYSAHGVVEGRLFLLRGQKGEVYVLRFSTNWLIKQEWNCLSKATLPSLCISNLKEVLDVLKAFSKHKKKEPVAEVCISYSRNQ
ncbi:hypothetical protein KI387_027728, partial [Taxus chinensis]